jgi:hypothetical protein
VVGWDWQDFRCTTLAWSQIYLTDRAVDCVRNIMKFSWIIVSTLNKISDDIDKSRAIVWCLMLEHLPDTWTYIALLLESTDERLCMSVGWRRVDSFFTTNLSVLDHFVCAEAIRPSLNLNQRARTTGPCVQMMRSNRDWDHGSLINRSGLGGNEPVTVTQKLGSRTP